jgi:hypothetical protein
VNHRQEDTTRLASNRGPSRFDGIRFSGPKADRDARGLALLDAILPGKDTGYEPSAYPASRISRRNCVSVGQRNRMAALLGGSSGQDYPLSLERACLA